MRYWLEGSNFLIIILLIASNVSLLHYLKKKEKIMAEKLGNITVFKSEKIKLASIAMTFVCSYILDLFYLFFIRGQDIKETYGNNSIIIEEIYYIIDPIPILVILFFHLKNFKFVPVKVA